MTGPILGPPVSGNSRIALDLAYQYAKSTWKSIFLTALIALLIVGGDADKASCGN